MGAAMAKRISKTQIAVDVRVRVDAHTPDEVGGVVVEDFGDAAGEGVNVGGVTIAPPARRWAVLLDNGMLAFVDSNRLVPE
jgi:hypothetical protein